MNELIYLSGVIFLFMGCEVKPQKINFGVDNCHYCKMTIVDKQHATEVVTTKGKAFKYDAIECMLNHISTWDGPDINLFLVSDYSDHNNLIDATMATFLECEAIPSPMGANLSAFQNKEDALKTKDKLGGKIYDWKSLKEKFKVEL